MPSTSSVVMSPRMSSIRRPRYRATGSARTVAPAIQGAFANGDTRALQERQPSLWAVESEPDGRPEGQSAPLDGWAGLVEQRKQPALREDRDAVDVIEPGVGCDRWLDAEVGRQVANDDAASCTDEVVHEHRATGGKLTQRTSEARRNADGDHRPIRSVPRYGRSTSGTRIEPSGSWYVSSRAATVRASASPEPFNVWTSSG